MTSSLRLRLCMGVVLFSLLYGVIVVTNPEVASAIAAGYVAVLLTVLIMLNVWRKP